MLIVIAQSLFWQFQFFTATAAGAHALPTAVVKKLSVKHKGTSDSQAYLKHA